MVPVQDRSSSMNPSDKARVASVCSSPTSSLCTSWILQDTIFKYKKVYHSWFKLVKLCTLFLPFQYILPQYHIILTTLEVSTSKTNLHPLHPLHSFALCNYNQICKPHKIDSLPCILISMASPLEQTGLQDVEFTV